MKKTITLLTAVAMLASVANAELLKNFKYDGKLEVNAYNVNNADFDKNSDDKVGDVDTRLILNMSFDLNEDANAVVTVVKNNRQWGAASENANAVQTAATFQQAYLNLKGVMGLNHKIGRQFYGNPNDLVIYYGPKMWPYPVNLPVSALDAWVGTYEYNDWMFTALMGKVTNAGSAPDADKNLSGIDVKKKIDVFNLNAYYYYQNDKTSGNSKYLGVLGLRANWECKFLKGLNLGLEYDMNTGVDTTATNDKDYKGYAYKVNADYSFDLAGKLGIGAEYLFMSGDDNAADKDNDRFMPINTDYRPTIIADGYGVNTTYVTSIGSGVNLYGFKLNWTPSALEKLNIATNYYDYSVDKENTGYDSHIGSELDIVATWNHSENVSVKGYYAMFKPEKKNVVADDAQTMFGAAFMVKF